MNYDLNYDDWNSWLTYIYEWSDDFDVSITHALSSW